MRKTFRERISYWIMGDDFSEIIDTIIENKYSDAYDWELSPMDDGTFDIIIRGEDNDEIEDFTYTDIIDALDEYFDRPVNTVVRLHDAFYQNDEFIIDFGYVEEM